MSLSAQSTRKPRLIGHWGTSPGLNFIYAHLSRVITERDSDAMFVCGPGHGGPAVVANAWLEGTYSERYPHVSRDEVGMTRLFRQFSFPGGIPSHASPETPGSIHEGGELGYALSHAFGAAFDNPGLVVACVVGDGEAETGPAATGWHSNKFLDPVHDGVVLPILHLNGYKIAAPAILARIPTRELLSLFSGYGYHPIMVEGGFDGEDPMEVHQRMAVALDFAFDEIADIQSDGTRRIPERSAHLADGDTAHPQGMDWTESRRWAAYGRDVALSSGPTVRSADESRPFGRIGTVAAELSSR